MKELQPSKKSAKPLKLAAATSGTATEETGALMRLESEHAEKLAAPVGALRIRGVSRV